MPCIIITETGRARNHTGFATPLPWQGMVDFLAPSYFKRGYLPLEVRGIEGVTL